MIKSLIPAILILLLATQTIAKYGQYKPHPFDPETNPIDTFVLQKIQEKIQQTEGLIFSRVLETRIQVASGLNYDLKLELELKDKVVEYEALLHVIMWEERAEFQRFQAIAHHDERIKMTETQLVQAIENYVVKQVYEKYKSKGIEKFITVGDFRIIEKQVVAGMKYTCKILLISPYIDLYNKAGDYRAYKVTLVYQAWLNNFELLDIVPTEYTEDDLQNHVADVENQRSQGSWNRYEFGGDEDQILKVIKSTLEPYIIKKGLNPRYTVLQCWTKVVSGQNIRVHLQIRGNEYEAVIYHQHWNNIQQVISFEQMESSNPESLVRGHVGSWTIVDWQKEPEAIRKLTINGLDDYLTTKGFHKKYEIIKAENQVVQGLRIKLYVKIESHVYISILKVRSWEDFSEVESFEQIENVKTEL